MVIIARMVNKYAYRFVNTCPVNNRPVQYHLVIESLVTIEVEKIMEKCAGFAPGFHETIADELHAEFAGHQTLRAHHHGVDIETQRGTL